MYGQEPLFEEGVRFRQIRNAPEEEGTLKSGSGRKVRSRKQAIAIGLSEAREKGAKAKVAPKKGRRRARKK